MTENVDIEVLEIFPWNENFNTHIPLIDEQHKQLVHILNKLASNLATLQKDEILDEVFHELADYAVYHFKSEESVWAEKLAADPRYQEHLKTHQSFLEQVLKIKNNDKESLDDKIREILTFLTQWLAFHILDTDRRMAKIIQALDEGQTLEQAKITSDEAMSGSMRILIKTILTMYDSLSSRSIDLMREKTLRERAENQLKISEARWQFLLESSGEAIWDWDLRTADKTQSSLVLFNNTEGKYGDKIHPADLEKVKSDFDSHIGGKTDFYINKHRRIKSDGSWSWILSRGKVVSRDLDGKPTRMVGIHSDITERELASLIYQHSSQGMFVSDADNNIISTNPAFTAITGYSSTDVVEHNPKILSSGKHDNDFYAQMWQEIEHTNKWQGEIWNKRKNGDIFASSLNINRVLGEDGKVDHYIALFMDITEQKEANEQIFKNAYYDLLTGLPNRALLSDRFNIATAHSKRTNSQLAVCFLDLDNFKPINDNYGHEVGDLVLIDVANRIKTILREMDTVSRLGGDEFALLLNDIQSLAQAECRIDRIVQALAEPFYIQGQAYTITASIGMTLYPDDNADLDLLLRHADQAMYLAKLEGKNRQRLFNTANNQQIISRQEQLNRLKLAISENELQLYYQPKVNMATGNVFGAEALIRWNHPEKGILSPIHFLPLINGTNLENQLGEWVINQALKQMAEWQQAGIELEVSVNISTYHLQSDSFLSELETALSHYPESLAKQLQLEILESSALGDINHIGSIITACQTNLGVNLALDDFGTGYSSLTHLRNLSANTIKIDQSFVRDMLDDPDDFAIIDGVIGLANSFNREVIAEGVETTAHGSLLLTMGCHQAQGYGIAKPLPPHEFVSWYKNYQPNQEWLKLGNSELLPVQQRYKIFQVTIERWKELFIANIESDDSESLHWPIMDETKCHCGIWLKRTKQDNLIDKEELQALDEAHHALHQTASRLFELYQDKQTQTARDEIETFHQDYVKLMAFVQK